MRSIRFTFLLDEGEKEMLENMSLYLQRAQSDVIRILIKACAEMYGIKEGKAFINLVNSSKKYYELSEGQE